MHAAGSYPLLFTLSAQFFVLFQAWKSKDTLMIIQAICLIGANGLASAALPQRPHLSPQRVPDVMGTVAALFLLTPAVIALIKLKSQEKQSQQQSQQQSPKKKLTQIV